MRREHPYRLVYRVTDLNHMDYDVVKALLDQNGVEYDCMFIETKRGVAYVYQYLSLIHISEPTRPAPLSRMPSSA